MDGRELLTSTEAADLLGTSPTSVKRWADEGLLRCVRTAGKHRRFTRGDLETFMRERMGAVPEPPPAPDGGWLEDLLDVRPYRLDSRLFEMRSRLGSWRAVCDAMGGVLTELGDAWARGDVSVVEEHLASERLARAIARVAETLPVSPSAPRALLLTLEGEEHTLGLSLVELALRELGWMPIWSGRRTPLEGLAEHLDAQRVELLAVSSSVVSNDPGAMARAAEELASICRPRGVALLLGGSGAWPDPPAYGTRLSGFSELDRVARPQAR